MGDGGGGHWLVQMEWRPAGWSVCLPLLIFPCIIKSRSSLLAPAHLGGPGKRAVKWLWWWWCATATATASGFCCSRIKKTLVGLVLLHFLGKCCATTMVMHYCIVGSTCYSSRCYMKYHHQTYFSFRKPGWCFSDLGYIRDSRLGQTYDSLSAK